MKKKIVILFLVFSAFGRGESASLKRSIERIIEPKKNRHLKAGIIVYSLDKNRLLYEYQADELMVPASVNKLFTTYGALKTLGPTATFETEVYRRGVVTSAGELKGDIYLKGGGDPSLVSERMWMLTNEFLRSGIKKITGNIYGDDSYFDKERNPSSRPSYLKDQAYNAPVGALSFNFNTTTIYVRPTTKGKSPRVYVDPQNEYIDVVNQATTGSRSSRLKLSVSRLKQVKGDVGDSVLVRGSIPQDHKEVYYYRNIVNPTLYAAHMFHQFLKRRGVDLMGYVSEGKVPRGAKRLVKFDSLPMWQITWGLNKFSNNFVADQILKKMGAHAYGAPGTIKKGIQALEKELSKIGIKKGSYQITDGSGLTRKTKVSARQILTLLLAGYDSWRLSHEFLVGLSVSGVDGTLRSRLKKSVTKGLVRGKTGALDGVNTLAGVLENSQKERVAFVILLNDPKLKYGRMINWIDKISLAIAQYRTQSE